ncbi:MAG: hypothetical protein JNM02_08335 [Anaerolineales bacterium]|nr:hypothetical protein [Anaerolineales bacterium]
MKVELSRFRVKAGKSTRVDEWLKMLNDNMSEVIQTLDREQMKIEVIFREMIDGEEYLYWFEVHGEAGELVITSPFELDHKHIAFHDECIDHTYGAHESQPQVVMVPADIAQAMGWENPSASITNFERREIVRYRPE